MRIENLMFMILYCLLGILQIRNPTPLIVFIDILIIIMLIYFLDRSHEGWGRALKSWRETIDDNISNLNQGSKNGS